MTASDLANWMIVYVAVLIGDPSDSLSLDTPIGDYDFDSIDAVNMALELEGAAGFPISPELFLDSSRSLGDVLEILSPQLGEERRTLIAS